MRHDYCAGSNNRGTSGHPLIYALRYSKGFTLTELTVVVVIIGFIAAMLFYNRANIYQERAERTAMTEVVGAIQHQLLMNYGHLMARGGGEKEIAALTTENPMSWMSKVPDNYAGEFHDPSPDTVAPGSWMFDLDSRELIYVPERTVYLAPDTHGKMWIRYRTRLKYDADQPASPGERQVKGVLFEPVEPYHWFD